MSKTPEIYFKARIPEDMDDALRQLAQELDCDLSEAGREMMRRGMGVHITPVIIRPQWADQDLHAFHNLRKAAHDNHSTAKELRTLVDELCGDDMELRERIAVVVNQVYGDYLTAKKVRDTLLNLTANDVASIRFNLGHLERNKLKKGTKRRPAFLNSSADWVFKIMQTKAKGRKTPKDAADFARYMVDEVHPRHVGKRIESRHIGCANQTEFQLAIASVIYAPQPIRRGPKLKNSAVELEGGMPYGIELEPSERRKIEDAVVTELDLMECLFSWHISRPRNKKRWREDFHVLAANRDSLGRPLSRRCPGQSHAPLQSHLRSSP